MAQLSSCSRSWSSTRAQRARLMRARAKRVHLSPAKLAMSIDTTPLYADPTSASRRPRRSCRRVGMAATRSPHHQARAKRRSRCAGRHSPAVLKAPRKPLTMSA